MEGKETVLNSNKKNHYIVLAAIFICMVWMF